MNQQLGTRTPRSGGLVVAVAMLAALLGMLHQPAPLVAAQAQRIGG